MLVLGHESCNARITTVQNVRDCNASLNVSISHISSVPAPLYLRTLWRYTYAVIIIIIIIIIIVQSCNFSPPRKNSLPFFEDEGVNDAN